MPENFLDSIVLDPDTGFGGDGDKDAAGCITDGPFVNVKNSLGPGYEITDRCIDRNVSNRDSQAAAQENIDQCHATTTYLDFWRCIEGLPHGAGHGGVGGQVRSNLHIPSSS